MSKLRIPLLAAIAFPTYVSADSIAIQKYIQHQYLEGIYAF